LPRKVSSKEGLEISPGPLFVLIGFSDYMQPKERYLPVEVDFGSVKARVRIKVRENETAAEIAKRMKGIEVEETRMGAYIKRINLEEFLFKNREVVVDYVDGDIKKIDGKSEQWIQVYVDGGLPVIAVNNEAIGLGISNFYVGGIGILTIKDEEKTEKYMKDFSYSDVEAIIKGAISNRVSVSCPGGVASAEFSRKVFDAFFILKEDGVVSFYDGSPETKPLGWKEWVFPEKGIDRKYLEGTKMYRIYSRVDYLTGACMLGNKKMIGLEFRKEAEKENGHEKNYYEEGRRAHYENAERLTDEWREIEKIEIIESKKIENGVSGLVGAFHADQEKKIRFDPMLELEMSFQEKEKTAPILFTPKAKEYILFEEPEEKLAEKIEFWGKGRERMERKGKDIRVDGFKIHGRIKCWEKNLGMERHGEVPREVPRKNIKMLSEFFLPFSKRIKIYFQDMVIRKEKMIKRVELGVLVLKEKAEKITSMVVYGLVDGVRDIIKKAKHRIGERMEKMKNNHNLEGLQEKRKNKKDEEIKKKNRIVIFLLLLEKLFPKIRRWGNAIYKG